MRPRLGPSSLLGSFALSLAACAMPHGVADKGTGDGGTLPAADGGADGGNAAATLEILPANPTLHVQSGTPSTLQLQAVTVGPQGQTPVSVSWALPQNSIASINATTGLLTASGPRGGQVQAVAVLPGGATATTTVTVIVTQTVFVNTTASVIPSFSQTPTVGGANAPAVLYPYDKTVIPVNLQALNLQWQPGMNDTFQVTLAGPYFTLVGYIVPTATSAGLQPAWQPDATDWQNFAESNIGADVTLTVAGSLSTSPGPVSAAADQKLTLAASRFAGTIYYWTVSGGQVMRLSANSTSAQSFYTPPAAPTTAQGPSGDTCMACHSVSPDGNKMSAELWNGGAPGSGTVLDMTQSPVVPALASGAETWMFSTFDSTGTLLLTSLGGALTLRDSTSGAPVPAGSGEGNQQAIGLGAPGLATQPSWSRDGTNVAFAQGIAGAFAGDVSFTETDLMTAGWNATTQTFSTPTVAAAHDFDGNELANFYPSFSTDTSLLAFTRSSCSYDCDTNDQLLIVPVGADGGAPIELVKAEGSDLRNRYPNFSPFKEGGYHWMAFFSMRDYGWVTQGQSQRQIWVTAIDDNGTPTTDPSHPSFWLPGQDPTTMNDKAEWAALPCVGLGASCQGNSDCCDGVTNLQCLEGDAGVFVCSR